MQSEDKTENEGALRTGDAARPAREAASVLCKACDGRGYVSGDPEGDPIEGCVFCEGVGRRLSVCHPVLGIQHPLTYRLDDCDAEIWAPGNATRWRLGEIKCGSPEQAEAYARLFCVASVLFDALQAADKRIDRMGPPAFATHGRELREIIRVAIARTQS